MNGISTGPLAQDLTYHVNEASYSFDRAVLMHHLWSMDAQKDLQQSFTISTRSEPYVIYLGPNQREGGLRRLASRRLPLFLALKGITVCATEMFGFVLLMCLVPQSFICTYASDKGTDFCIQNGRANSFIIPSLSASFARFIHFSFIMHTFTSQATLLDVIIIPLFGVSFCLIC